MKAGLSSSLGVIAWLGFAAAGAFTTASFVILDRSKLPPFASWWGGHHWLYAVLFFTVWGVPLAVWAAAIYISRNEERRASRRR